MSFIQGWVEAATAMGSRLRRYIKPSLVIPLLLAAALLALAFNLGDITRVLTRVGAVPVHIMLWVLGLAWLYLLAKLGQFYLLLAYLGLRPDRRRLWVAFAVGELTLTLPFGVFAQNWLLAATGDAMRFARNSAATLIMLLTEALVTLLWLAATGVPGWPLLRPAAAVCAVGIILFLPVLRRCEGFLGHHAQRRHHRFITRISSSLLALLDGCKQLASPRLLLINVVIAAAYLGVLAVAFMAVGRGVGLTLDYSTATTIYAFSLAVVLIGGSVLSQLGTVEVLGMTVAQAYGFGFTDGLALMLAFRLLWVGAIWLTSLPVVIIFWRSVRRASSQHIKKAPD